jgi:hypothetical protein
VAQLHYAIIVYRRHARPGFAVSGAGTEHIVDKPQR